MNLLTPTAEDLAQSEAPARTKPQRRWADKFGEAFKGIKLGIRGHSSFFVHFFFAALVVAAAIVLGCTATEWCIFLGCIGMVLTAELFNSAIETLFRGLDDATKQRLRGVLDISAGAVLMASIFAALIGSIMLLHKVGLI